MRGSDKRSGSLFSYVDLEARVRRDHPLRAIRLFADAALEALTVAFAELYSSTGRPSIPPEMLLRAMLLQAFYTIRSERQLIGADGVRPAVSLVRWPVDRRSDLGSLGVLEKPRSAPRGRCRGEVPQCGSGSAGSEATPVERTLQRRWYSHRGVGLDEELPTQGRGGYR